MTRQEDIGIARVKNKSLNFSKMIGSFLLISNKNLLIIDDKHIGIKVNITISSNEEII
jgi:hypothetical protein